MNILLAGGGTAGSVTPLLAVAAELRRRHPDATFTFVGTLDGRPERHLSLAHNLPFVGIHAGKLRRYASIENITDVWQTLRGLFDARRIVTERRPSACLTAGGFVSVPVGYACWLRRIPVFAHQQDLRPSLTNRLLAPIARHVTVTLEQSLVHFSRSKTTWTGNPVREHIFRGNRQTGRKRFGLSADRPVLLVVGGGTGSQAMNDAIAKILPAIENDYDVIHIVGEQRVAPSAPHRSYHPFPFLTDMSDAYAAADLVVCRAGMGTLSELAALRKAAIVIPLPHTHQEDNAEMLRRQEAALVIGEAGDLPAKLVPSIRELLADETRRRTLGKKLARLFPEGAAARIADLVETAI